MHTSTFNQYIETKMSFEINSILGILSNVLMKNIFTKILLAMFTYFVTDFVEPNQKMLIVVFIVFLFDFITGIWKAIESHSLSSARLIRGAVKLLVYIGLIFLGHAIDFAAQTGSLFMMTMFAYVIATDGGSIIENLQDLGYKTPAPLARFLKSYSKKLRKDKFSQIDPTFASGLEDYGSDISEMLKVYVPKIKDTTKRSILQIHLENWGIFCETIQNIEINDIDVFRKKVELLGKETLKDIEIQCLKRGIKESVFKDFRESNIQRMNRFFDLIQQIPTSEESNGLELQKIAILKELSILNYQTLNESLDDSK